MTTFLNKRFLMGMIALVFSTLLLVGCEEGPMEEAGETVDNAVENAADAVEDAGDKVEDAASN